MSAQTTADTAAPRCCGHPVSMSTASPRPSQAHTRNAVSVGDR